MKRHAAGPANTTGQLHRTPGMRWSTTVGCCLWGLLLFVASGCERASSNAKPASAARAESPPRAAPATPAPLPGKSTNGPARPAIVNADDLRGRSADEVAGLLGKPQGQIQARGGALWLYPQWRVQFDGLGRVLGVEKDAPIPLVALDPRTFGPKSGPGAGDARPGEAAAQAPGETQLVSNGGQEVDLAALVPAGKVTVVDFYADWCGPCRQISPYLERLAAQDPEVALVKVDIIDWDSAVARQFAIRSIPNIRVFDRSRLQIGSPTHDLKQVLDYVQQAKR